MKKLLLFINPFSGKKEGLLLAAKIKDFLKDKDFEIYEVISQEVGFLAEYIAKNDLNKFDMMGVVGGDGTMSEVVNAIFHKESTVHPSILLFPAGSGNAFNHDIMNLDFEKALQKLIAPTYSKVDVLALKTKTDSYFSFNIVGWGMVGNINKTAEKMRLFPNLRYNLATVWHILKNTKFQGRVEVDEEIFEGDFCFVLICNTKFTGKAMKIAPLASLEDGLADVLVVKHLSVFTLLQLFPQIFSGKHITSKHLVYKHAKKIKIDSPNYALVIDGEPILESPFTVQVLQQQLNVIL